MVRNSVAEIGKSPDKDLRRFERELVRLTVGIMAARLLLVAIHSRDDMGKLSDLGAAIRKLKEDHEREADALLEKVNGLSAAVPEVFARGHNFLDSVKKDAGELERELRALSNAIPGE